MKRKLLLALIYALLFSMFVPIVYGAEGDYIGVWSVDALNAAPVGTTTDGTNIWILDYTDKAVYKYDMSGGYDTFWNLNINNNNPYGITLNTTHIFVTDYTGKKVYVYEGGIIYPTPDAPTELFGAGFNGSTPCVELYWSHNNLTLVDVFEVQNSTDKITWDILGYNATTQYNDYQVVNGTDRYYRVRACKYQPDGWHNSSWIDDFEKVYFLKGGNGIGGGGVGGGGINLLWIVAGLLGTLVFMGVRRKR